jgi:hypothetical protein
MKKLQNTNVSIYSKFLCVFFLSRLTREKNSLQHFWYGWIGSGKARAGTSDCYPSFQRILRFCFVIILFPLYSAMVSKRKKTLKGES